MTQNLARPGIEPEPPHLYQDALLLGHPAHSCPYSIFQHNVHVIFQRIDLRIIVVLGSFIVSVVPSNITIPQPVLHLPNVSPHSATTHGEGEDVVHEHSTRVARS